VSSLDATPYTAFRATPSSALSRSGAASNSRLGPENTMAMLLYSVSAQQSAVNLFTAAPLARHHPDGDQLFPSDLELHGGFPFLVGRAWDCPRRQSALPASEAE